MQFNGTFEFNRTFLTAFLHFPCKQKQNKKSCETTKVTEFNPAMPKQTSLKRTVCICVKEGFSMHIPLASGRAGG